MSDAKHAALMAVLAAEDYHHLLTEDEYEEIQSLAEMFAPFKGSAPMEGARPTPLHCTNCDHRWEGPFTPQDLGRYAITAQRAAVCPRCCGNQNVMIGATA